MSTPERLRAIEQACAFVEATGPWGTVQGTAYRLSSRYAATSERLVRGLSLGDSIQLRFPSGEHRARLFKSDAEADCALLTLDSGIPLAAPLSISPAVKEGAEWEAYGYLTRDTLARLSQGELIDIDGEDPHRGPAYVLRPHSAATGQTPLAGSPVLVGGQVVGHIKSRFGSDSSAGPIYACPIRHVDALLPVEVKKSSPQPPLAAYDPAWYVPRDEEEQKATSYLNFPGQPVVLFAPELFGKTWLLRHLVQQVQKQDSNSRVVALNLDLFDQSSWQQPQGLDTFLRELALHISLSLGEPAENVHREWTTPSATANLDRVMRKHILPRVVDSNGRLLLAIDRSDAVLGTPFQNTFFGILRGWAESEEPWSCLRLVLSISTTPALLVSSHHQSPFNLTDAVELKDLNDEQIRMLARLYQLSPGPEDLSVLKHWVGGHPYLVRLAMFTAVRQGVPLAKLFAAEQSVAEVFDGFLGRVGRRLRSQPERFEALQQVLEAPSTELGEAELPLLRAGLLVRSEHGEFLPRYELYRRLGTRSQSGGRVSRLAPPRPGPAARLSVSDTGRAIDVLGDTSLVSSKSDEVAPLPRERIEIGKRLGPYQVVRELGRGGMGAVYEVVHEQLRRRAALKVLHPNLSADPELAKRFLTEARAANIIRHPSIIDIYEMGQLSSGDTYFIMEFLEGESLGDNLQRCGKLSLESTLRLSQQIAAGLRAAHEVGVVHRDLKPDNIMAIPDSVVPGGKRIKILDFGLAKVAKHNFDDALTTKTGVLMGTPPYMAPEQCRGAEHVDTQVDVYALGIILFEFLIGTPPFHAADYGDIIAMHLRDTPPSLNTLMPMLPPELGTLVERMLAKDPKQRPTMAEVQAELVRLEAQLTQVSIAPFEPEPSLIQSPVFWMGILSIVVAVLALAVISLTLFRHH